MRFFFQIYREEPSSVVEAADNRVHTIVRFGGRNVRAFVSVFNAGILTDILQSYVDGNGTHINKCDWPSRGVPSLV